MLGNQASLPDVNALCWSMSHVHTIDVHRLCNRLTECVTVCMWSAPACYTSRQHVHDTLAANKSQSQYMQFREDPKCCSTLGSTSPLASTAAWNMYIFISSYQVRHGNTCIDVMYLVVWCHAKYVWRCAPCCLAFHIHIMGSSGLLEAT